jgi:flagellar hook-basal body complex protein FliE
MAAPILPVSPILPVAANPAAGGSGAAAPGGFQQVFASALESVESAGQAASASVQRFLSGEGEELHSTILATQRAELSFDLFLQMRNKVVSAYQEIMRMQV